MKREELKAGEIYQVNQEGHKLHGKPVIASCYSVWLDNPNDTLVMCHEIDKNGFFDREPVNINNLVRVGV
jgi:hypothetical protein